MNFVPSDTFTHAGGSVSSPSVAKKESLTSIRFRPSNLLVEGIAVAIFYCAATQRVDADVAAALNHVVNGVFDGGIVVDERFRTSLGPEVLAAGPATVYRRRLFADEWIQRKYNSKEVGKKLAETLLANLFEGSREEEKKEEEEEEEEEQNDEEYVEVGRDISFEESFSAGKRIRFRLGGERNRNATIGESERRGGSDDLVRRRPRNTRQGNHFTSFDGGGGDGGGSLGGDGGRVNGSSEGSFGGSLSSVDTEDKWSNPQTKNLNENIAGGWIDASVERESREAFDLGEAGKEAGPDAATLRPSISSIHSLFSSPDSSSVAAGAASFAALPRFRLPMVTRCRLPRGVVWFHARRPNEAEEMRGADRFPLHPDAGKEFLTGSWKDVEGRREGVDDDDDVDENRNRSFRRGNVLGETEQRVDERDDDDDDDDDADDEEDIIEQDTSHRNKKELLNYAICVDDDDWRADEKKSADTKEGRRFPSKSPRRPRGIFYFRLDAFRRVAEVLCVSRDLEARSMMETPEHLERLVGLHVSLLNNVVERMSEGMIEDLFEFFEEPWAAALFHDRFKVHNSSWSMLFFFSSSGGG